MTDDHTPPGPSAPPAVPGPAQAPTVPPVEPEDKRWMERSPGWRQAGPRLVQPSPAPTHEVHEIDDEYPVEPEDNRWKEPSPRTRREGPNSELFPPGLAHDIRYVGDDEEEEGPLEHFVHTTVYRVIVAAEIIILAVITLVLNWVTHWLEEDHALPFVIFLFKFLEVFVAVIDVWQTVMYVGKHVLKTEKRK